MTRRMRNPHPRLSPKTALNLLIQLSRGEIYAVSETKAALEQHVKHYLHRARPTRG